MTDLEAIQKELFFRFPDSRVSVTGTGEVDEQITINFDAYATEGEAKKIKRYVDKIMAQQYPSYDYTVKRMPF